MVFRQVAKIGFGSLILICSPHQEFTEETMKELAMTIMALLLTGAMMFICSPDAKTQDVVGATGDTAGTMEDTVGGTMAGITEAFGVMDRA